MKIDQLHKLNFPLTEDHVEFMVKQLYDTGSNVWAQILPYKTARTDMDILDEIVGPGDWQVEYKRDSKGMLKCGLGIYVDEREDYVWKWYNGTSSQFESEKGEYSDAFKRVGYMWGIGRCLYDFPTIRVQLIEGEYKITDRGLKATNRLNPKYWRWKVEWDPSRIVAKSKVGQNWPTRYDSNPYESQNPDKR